jgi:hypothetical protein
MQNNTTEKLRVVGKMAELGTGYFPKGKSKLYRFASLFVEVKTVEVSGAWWDCDLYVSPAVFVVVKLQSLRWIGQNLLRRWKGIVRL